MTGVLIAIFKYVGMLLAGAFGVYGLVVEFKNDGVVTKQGRIALALIIVSTIVAIGSQSLELLRAHKETSAAQEREQNDQRETARKTLEAIERNSTVLAEIGRNLHRIEDVRVHFAARVTLDRAEFRQYRSRLESGVHALKEKYNTDRAAFYNEHNGGTSTGPNDELLSLTIGPDHPLFPDEESEADANRLFTGASFHVQFYKKQISFDRHPLGWTGRGIQADTELDFYSPDQDNVKSLKNRVEFVYEFGRDDVPVDDVLVKFSKELDPDSLQKRTAKIESLSDLPESQAFFTAETGWSRHNEVSLNHHPELEYAILWMNGHKFWFMRDDMTRHVNSETGVPMFEFLFPKDLSDLERE